MILSAFAIVEKLLLAFATILNAVPYAVALTN
jgi:hypothetical protein